MRVGLFARLGIGALLAAFAVAAVAAATATAGGSYSQPKKLAVTKTAKTSWTRTWTWTVDKKVDPATLDLVDGDSGTVTWSIAAKATRKDSYSVSGTIKVSNPNGSTVSGVSVSDSLAGAVVDCRRTAMVMFYLVQFLMLIGNNIYMCWDAPSWVTKTSA